MLTVLIALLILLTLEMGVVLYYLRKYFNRMNINNIIDPFYPAFSKEFILKAKIDLIAAEQKYEDAHAEAYQEYQENGSTKLQWTSNIKVYRIFSESDVEFRTTRERFHRLIEGNIAALNGKNISSVVDEYNDWLRNRMFEDLKVINEAVEWFQQSQLQKTVR